MGKQSRGVFLRGRIWWIQYAGINGENIRESSRSTKMRDAEDLRALRISELRTGEELIPKRQKFRSMSFLELTDKYIEFEKVKPTFRKFKAAILKNLRTYFQNLKVHRIGTKEIDELKAFLISEEYSPSTVNKYLAVMQHVFSKSHEWEYVDEKQLLKIRKPRKLKENNKRLRYLSAEEWEAYVSQCPQYFRNVAIIAVNTGMRKEELLSLRWDQVDLKSGYFSLRRTKSGKGRQIPINTAARRVLMGLPRSLPKDGVYPYVFSKPDGTRYNNIKRVHSTVCAKAGIHDYHFHDHRHTFASTFIMNGGDIRTLQEILGHHSVTMTMRYAHLGVTHTKEAMENVSFTASGNKGGTRKASRVNEKKQAGK